MLSDYDDYLCHQTLDPLEHPYTPDRRFYARYFITFYDHEGGVLGITAVANYPNAGVQDGYAVLVHDGVQRNLRVSRLLDHDPHVLAVGPVRVEVLEPLKRFRIVCDANDLGFSWDVECETTSAPWERRRRFSPRSGGRLSDVSNHWNQGYRCRGSVTIDGTRHAITPERWSGVRDRSWGIGRFWEGDYSYGASVAYGNFAGLRPAFVPHDRGPYAKAGDPASGPFGHHNSWVNFPEHYLAVSFRPHIHTLGGALVAPWGSDEPQNMILGIERKEPVFRGDGSIERCDLVYTDEHGTAHEMTATPLTYAWEAGCGYADMGTGYEMGKPLARQVGVPHLEGETRTLADLGRFARDQKVQGAASSTIAFHVAEYRWGDTVGYGSLEADPNELARLPYARYYPPTVRNEAPLSNEQGT